VVSIPPSAFVNVSRGELRSESLQSEFVLILLENEHENLGSESHRQRGCPSLAVCADLWHLGGFSTQFT
jgi:hypothetical protein